MGAQKSKASSLAEPFAGVDTTLTDHCKKLIAHFKSNQNKQRKLTEHVPSVKAKDLKSEIEKASDISKMAFAPEPTLIDYSIFDCKETEQMKIRDEILDFRSSKYKSNDILDRCLGSMYGMCVGDAWGHLLEFVPVQYEKVIIKELDAKNYKYPEVLNRFGLKPGQWTDDTSMGLCLADTLLTCGHIDPIDLRKRFCMWWYLGYNNAFRYDEKWRKNKTTNGRSVGLGGQIGYSLKCFLEEPTVEYAYGDPNMSGNGSIMRLAPLPLFYRDSSVEEVVCESMNQSFTTHSGLQSAECAAALSYVIVSALKSDSKTGKEFLDNLDFSAIETYITTDAVKCILSSTQNTKWTPDKYSKEDKDQYWNWKDPDYKYSPTRSALTPGYVGGYACDNIAMALHCIYHTTSFGEAVLRCINRCGDADTVGSVTGQIAGALYGISNIPVAALECIFNWDPNGEIALRVIKMFEGL